MRLRILLPTEVLADAAVLKVSAEGLHGSFMLLPRHADFLVALVPGLLAYQPVDGSERFAAVDAGLLVKYGSEVLVSTQRAVVGPDLGRVRETVDREFRTVGERERVVRGAVARLEADFIRRFLEMGEGHRA